MKNNMQGTANPSGGIPIRAPQLVSLRVAPSTSWNTTRSLSSQVLPSAPTILTPTSAPTILAPTGKGADLQCPCGYLLPSDALFCPNCGNATKVQQLQVCSCGKILPGDATFCQRC